MKAISILEIIIGVMTIAAVIGSLLSWFLKYRKEQPDTDDTAMKIANSPTEISRLPENNEIIPDANSNSEVIQNPGNRKLG